MRKRTSLKSIQQRFMTKYGIKSTDAVRVTRTKGKIRKEVWLYGRGWVSEAAFRRYLGGSMLGLYE